MFRTSTVQNSAIRGIKASGCFVQLKHENGTILMLQQFTGFHEFVMDLRRVNPNVETKGV